MITDRLTARVLGLLLIVLPFLIDVSCLLFSQPELRAKPGFVGIVFGSTIPLFAAGAWLLRKASRLPDDTEQG